MLRYLALILLTACSINGATPATPPPAPTPAATFAAPPEWASICGTVGGQIRRSGTTPASFELNSPSRAPIRITWEGPAPVDSMPGGYVCAYVEMGSPRPVFAGFIGPAMPGYVAEGDAPATAAGPAPVGFVIPQACGFVAAPVVEPDRSEWWYDCGEELNHDARGALRDALTEQGWTSCGPVTASETWLRDGLALRISESSLAPGDYPRLSQRRAPGC